MKNILEAFISEIREDGVEKSDDAFVRKILAPSTQKLDLSKEELEILNKLALHMSMYESEDVDSEKYKKMIKRLLELGADFGFYLPPENAEEIRANHSAIHNAFMTHDTVRIGFYYCNYLFLEAIKEYLSDHPDKIDDIKKMVNVKLPDFVMSERENVAGDKEYIHAPNQLPILCFLCESRKGDIESFEKQFKLLLDLGADITDLDSLGRGIMYYASKGGYALDVLKVLEQRNINDYTKFLYDVIEGDASLDVIRELRKNGAEISMRKILKGMQKNDFPLEKLRSVEMILREMEQSFSEMEYNNLLFHVRNDSSATKTIKALIEAGADVNVSNNLEETLFSNAIKKELSWIVKALGEVGAEVDKKSILELMGKNKFSLEMLKEVEELLKNTNQPLTKDEYMHLLFENQNNSLTVVNALIAACKDEHILHKALYGRASQDVVEALIEAGADVNMVNEKGETPLNIAILSRNSQNIVEVLIKAGADINMVDKKGTTPLNIAESVGAPQDIKQALIAAREAFLKCSKSKHEPSGKHASHARRLGSQDSAKGAGR